jgi:hypothetical protein
MICRSSFLTLTLIDARNVSGLGSYFFRSSLFVQLKGPMPIMIWIAIVVEAAIQNWLDMGILLGIQFINATIGW